MDGTLRFHAQRRSGFHFIYAFSPEIALSSAFCAVLFEFEELTFIDHFSLLLFGVSSHPINHFFHRRSLHSPRFLHPVLRFPCDSRGDRGGNAHRSERIRRVGVDFLAGGDSVASFLYRLSIHRFVLLLSLRFASINHSVFAHSLLSARFEVAALVEESADSPDSALCSVFIRRASFSRMSLAVQRLNAQRGGGMV